MADDRTWPKCPGCETDLVPGPTGLSCPNGDSRIIPRPKWCSDATYFIRGFPPATMVWFRGGYLPLYTIEGHCGLWRREGPCVESEQIVDAPNGNVFARARRRGRERVYLFTPGPKSPPMTRRDKEDAADALVKLAEHEPVVVGVGGCQVRLGEIVYEGNTLADACAKALKAAIANELNYIARQYERGELMVGLMVKKGENDATNGE